MSLKSPLNTKSVRRLGFAILRAILSPHWSDWMAIQSISTLVASWSRLKMVRLLGLDSVLGG